MKRVALKMKIREGTAAEYKRRHDQIWPELNALLRSSGISDYSIFLDEETLDLFAVQKLADDHTSDQLAENPLIKKWCEYMADIVLMDDSGRPICTPLPEMYHLD
ncbi:MAG: L-rhamnose mutarotase [Pirellulales bacterium]|nr:L-rhamnose mutarotase [Pirellulales bacterium]